MSARLSTEIFITSTLIFKQMRQEYGYFLSGGWKIGICLLSAAMIALGVWGACLPFLQDSFDWILLCISLPMGLAFAVLIAFALVDTFKSKLILLEDRIQKVDVFNVKELRLEEINGYRKVQSGIQIVPKNPKLPTIGISLFYKKSDELVSWLEGEYPDLDELAKQAEEQEILLKDEFGRSPEERARKLQKARKRAKLLNISGVLVGLWVLVYPFPYVISTGIAILFPLLVIVALNKYKGLTRIEEKKDTAQPQLFTALSVPSAGLAIRGLMDFNLLDYSGLWVFVGAGVLILLGIFVRSSMEFNFRKWSGVSLILVLGLFVTAYVFGSTVIINCLYDASAPEVYQTRVISKRISAGKSVSYYLELSPWGPRQEVEEVSVGSYLYEKIEAGELVEVNVKKGVVGIPWFFLREP